MELAMTGDVTITAQYYETSYDLDVWRTTVRPGGNQLMSKSSDLLGHYGWDAPRGKWQWWKSVDVETLTAADLRHIKAAEPAGDPVVRLKVKP